MKPPYWQDDYSAVWHGDAIEVMASLPDRPDLIITSPPYNLGIGSGGGMAQNDSARDLTTSRLRHLSTPNYYGDHDDAMPMADYIRWQQDFTLLAWQMLSDVGALAYNHKPRIFDGHEIWPTAYVHPELEPHLRQTVILDRRGGLNFTATFFVPSYEVLLIYARPAWRLQDGAWGATSVWPMPRSTRARWHPAPFDKSVPKRLIVASNPGLVLDPFMGSGSTLIAARELGVASYGIDNHLPFVNQAIIDIAKAEPGMMVVSTSARTRQRAAALQQPGLDL